MKRALWALLTVASVLALSVLVCGCSTGAASGESPASSSPLTQAAAGSRVSAGTGFLATTSDSAAFLQWNEAGGSITGSEQTATLSGMPPKEQVSTDTYAVSGQRNGISISFTLTELGLPSSTLVGTTSGGTLVLNMPQKDGALAPVTFSSGTADDFNQALTGLQGTADAADQAAEQAANTQQEQNTIDQAVQNVRDDVSGLNDRVARLQSDVSATAKDVQAMKGDVDKTAADQQAVLAEAKQYPDGNNGQVGADAAGVASDAASVAADTAQVHNDAGSVEDGIFPSGIVGASVPEDIAKLQADFAALGQAEAAAPGYVHPSVSVTEVDQAITSAQSAAAAARADTNKYIDQANSYVRSASGYAASAAHAAGNEAPDTPSLLDHIS